MNCYYSHNGFYSNYIIQSAKSASNFYSALGKYNSKIYLWNS